jgi:preprotein translocase subunit SecF
VTNRRRNLFVLVLVFVLLAGSAWVITDKRTVLGLDLRGGTELVYQGLPSAQVPEVQPDDIDRAIEIGSVPTRSRSASRTSRTRSEPPSRSARRPSSTSTTGRAT